MMNERPYGAQVQQHGREVRAAIAGQGRRKGTGWKNTKEAPDTVAFS